MTTRFINKTKTKQKTKTKNKNKTKHKNTKKVQNYKDKKHNLIFINLKFDFKIIITKIIVDLIYHQQKYEHNTQIQY